MWKGVFGRDIRPLPLTLWELLPHSSAPVKWIFPVSHSLPQPRPVGGSVNSEAMKGGGLRILAKPEQRAGSEWVASCAKVDPAIRAGSEVDNPARSPQGSAGFGFHPQDFLH